METYSIMASAMTVVSFLAFLGIVLWAWSGRRKASFDDAAMAPFALDDEASPMSPHHEAERASHE